MEQAFDWLDAPIRRVASKDVPVACSIVLEQVTIPGTQDIIKAVKEILDR